MTQLSAEWLARHVDISCVQASHSLQDIENLAATASLWNFVSAHVLPNRLAELRRLLAGTGILAGSPVGFPSGGAATRTKAVEAQLLLDQGVQELDVVINIGRLRSREFSYVQDEASEIVALAAHRIPVRLILEVSLLTDDEIVRGTEIAIDAGADYVKTGTGWAGPTTLHHIDVISEAASGRIMLKAAGGIRTLDDIEAMAARGVVRFGINDQRAVALLGELGAR